MDSCGLECTSVERDLLSQAVVRKKTLEDDEQARIVMADLDCDNVHQVLIYLQHEIVDDDDTAPAQRGSLDELHKLGGARLPLD